MPDQSDTKILIHLLDDPDAEVYNHVRETLIKIGLSAIDQLEEAWFSTTDVLTTGRIEEIIDEIQMGSVRNDLAIWDAAGGNNLLGAFLPVTKFQYPNIELETLQLELNKIVRSIWIELNESQSSVEKIRVVNKMLFKVHKFHVVAPDLVMPEHYFLNNLIQNRAGTVISMAMFYQVICESLNLPVQCVDIPHNFLCGFMHTPDEFTNDYIPSSAVKFYINPAMRGDVLSRNDILYHFEQSGLKMRDKYLEPINNIAVLRKWVAALSQVYEMKNLIAKKRAIERLMQIISSPGS